MELGSPLAQALSAVDGLRNIRLEDDELFVQRDPDAGWHGVIDDITAVLKDFFL